MVGASWDSVIFDVPGRGRLQRVPTREPLRGTEALTGALFARHREAGPFLAELLGLPPGSLGTKDPASAAGRGNMAYRKSLAGARDWDQKEKMMAGQEQQQPQSRDTEVDEDIPAAPPAPRRRQASAATQGVDDLLDEIDGVLESNAEEFVRAFVQKGGQ